MSWAVNELGSGWAAGWEERCLVPSQRASDGLTSSFSKVETKAGKTRLLELKRLSVYLIHTAINSGEREIDRQRQRQRPVCFRGIQ